MTPLEETKDAAEIRRVACHPEVRPGLIGEVLETWTPPFPDGVHYLIEGDVLCIVIRKRPDVYECHVGALPGTRARDPARRAIEWVRQNTSCRLLMGHIPKTNLAALVNARAVGMKELTRYADKVLVGMEL